MVSRPPTSSTPKGTTINDNERTPRTPCTCLPHGFYTLIPITLSFAAWVASLSQDGCDFATVSGPIISQLMVDEEKSNSVPYLEFGFNGYRIPMLDSENDGEQWYIDYTSKCHDYGEDFVVRDIYWEISRAFSFLSLVLGGGGAIFLWFSGCFIFSPATWRWTGYEILVAAMFQLGSFLWFQTTVCQDNPDNMCQLRFGSKSDIVAITFWLISAFAILIKYPSPPRIRSVMVRADDYEDDGDSHVTSGDQSDDRFKYPPSPTDVKNFPDYHFDFFDYFDNAVLANPCHDVDASEEVKKEIDV